MRKRPDGFLADDKIDHNGEIFDYIRELHDYLWDFVRVAFPYAGGNLHNWVDHALLELQHRNKKNNDPQNQT